MSAKERIEQVLTAALAPLRLRVVDDSHRHVGHAGHDGHGESHFRVEVVSERFSGLGRIDRQRLVHELLAAEFAGRLHALQLRTSTPAEDAARARR